MCNGTMSLRSSISRAARPVFNSEPCVLCRFRAPQLVRQYATQPKYRITKEQQKTMTPQEMRADIDRRNRHAYFTLMKAERLLFGGPLVIEEMITEFQAAEKYGVDPATNVQTVAKKYKALVGDITYIAIPLARIPDIKDPSATIPPSQHPELAARMLLACSAAKDVMATLQIVSAFYLSSEYDYSPAKDLFRSFTMSDANKAMAMMEDLAKEGDEYCMTMQGRILERSQRKDEAKALYRKALEKMDLKFNPAWPHPMGLPWTPPWITLPDLLLSSPNPTPEAKAEALAALKKGALQAGDPLACYKLACLEETKSPLWLQCMSKAAASGHLEATYQLGHFYMDVHHERERFLADKPFKKALNFIMSFREDGALKLAQEWFEIAAYGGHKPAMLELAELSAEYGLEDVAIGYLQRILEAPPAGKAEQWPKLVEETKRRLARMMLAKPRVKAKEKVV